MGVRTHFQSRGSGDARERIWEAALPEGQNKGDPWKQEHNFKGVEFIKIHHTNFKMLSLVEEIM